MLWIYVIAFEENLGAGTKICYWILLVSVARMALMFLFSFHYRKQSSTVLFASLSKGCMFFLVAC